MIERVDWDELPDAVRAAVEERTGRVAATEVHQQGLNCATALTLHSANGGATFLKGVYVADTEGVTALAREELVNPWVRTVGPAARHAVRAAGWACLLFDHVKGRNADLAPQSADLAAVAAVLEEMGQLTDAPVRGAERLVERLAPHLAVEEAAALDGERLLHTDTNPHNLMVDGAGRVHVIDWAMPALGPGWVDAAYTAVRLMECGHTAESAMRWLAGIDVWQHADPAAVAAFVAGTCRQWTAMLGERDAEPSNARFRALLPTE